MADQAGRMNDDTPMWLKPLVGCGIRDAVEMDNGAVVLVLNDELQVTVSDIVVDWDPSRRAA